MTDDARGTVRGYYGVGVYHAKTSANIGTLWRTASIYGADFIFTVGRRYEKQASDTVKAWRHCPLWHFTDMDDLRSHIPFSCRLVCVEQTEGGHDLRTFVHPERAIYLLGAEDAGLPESIMAGHTCVQIGSPTGMCLNVATAGSIIIYDRWIKGGA